MEILFNRATIEEVYFRSMTKLAKSASNYSQLGWVNFFGELFFNADLGKVLQNIRFHWGYNSS